LVLSAWLLLGKFRLVPALSVSYIGNRIYNYPDALLAGFSVEISAQIFTVAQMPSVL